MDSHDFLYTALIFLGAGVVAVYVFRKLGLGSVLGYLAAGSLIGPWGIGLVRETENTFQLAELGVVLLLFIIGLELSPRRLWVMRKNVFGLGSAQVLLTTLLLALLAIALGNSWLPALVMGVALSLSSTAFALQILAEKKQLNTGFGRSAFGILLFQDLAAIPVLAILPLLAAGKEQVSEAPLFTFLKVVGVILGLIVGGRYLLRPLLAAIASTKLREAFTAAALLLVIGVGLLMESIGVSMAFGAFVAGLLLADSEHRHELEADIEPFKGLLLGLFFISVGMSVNYGLLKQQPALIAALVLGLIAIKSGVLYAIGRFSGLGDSGARGLAFTISQGGEFAFVIFTMAMTSQILAEGITSILNLVVTISMALTPLLVFWNERYFSRWFKVQAREFDRIEENDNLIIIAGFGRVGQMTGRILRLKNIGFTALEADQNQVDVLRKFGIKVYYGDASRIELLHAAGAHRAKHFVLAIDDIAASVKTATIVREHFPHLKVFARARNRAHAYELMALGIETTYRETLGTALEMATDVVEAMGEEREEAEEIVRSFRKHDEIMMREQFRLRHDEKQMIEYSKQYAQQLESLLESERGHR